jgi:hypothetical protein
MDLASAASAWLWRIIHAYSNELSFILAAVLAIFGVAVAGRRWIHEAWHAISHRRRLNGISRKRVQRYAAALVPGSSIFQQGRALSNDEYCACLTLVPVGCSARGSDIPLPDASFLWNASCRVIIIGDRGARVCGA